MKDVYIGLGSNLNNPLRQIMNAQKSLSQLPETTLVASSKCYRTPPLDAMDQPSYINAVSHLRTELAAAEMLLQLQQIENQQGRQRGGSRWQARSLDLDILLYGDEVIDSEYLTIPHYAMAKRNFVMFPLLELNPRLIIPGLGSAAKIAAQLSRDGLVTIAPDDKDVIILTEPIIPTPSA